MQSQISNFRTRLSSFLGGDVELEQALIRCVFVFVIALYVWSYPQVVPMFPASPRLVTLAYLSVSIPVFIWIIASPGKNHSRRITFTVLDQVLTAYAISFGGHLMPVIAVAYWVIIGSGFRYGRGYLYLSAGTAMLGVLFNMALNPIWHEYFFIGLGYLISIAVVALYTTSLLARVAETNRKLNESLKSLSNLAHIDNLTGLPNRLSLVKRLTQSIAMTKRQRTYVSLLYFDLDGFKEVNDSLGHNQGDALLKEVAKRITARIRTTDMLARLGGDEFVIILECTRFPQDSELVASIIMDTIRGIAIEGVHHVTNKKISLHVSASIGIATYGPDLSPDAPLVEEFIQRADDAMYLAKKAGKDCFRVWAKHIAVQPSIGIA